MNCKADPSIWWSRVDEGIFWCGLYLLIIIQSICHYHTSQLTLCPHCIIIVVYIYEFFTSHCRIILEDEFRQYKYKLYNHYDDLFSTLERHYHETRGKSKLEMDIVLKFTNVYC